MAITGRIPFFDCGNGEPSAFLSIKDGELVWENADEVVPATKAEEKKMCCVCKTEPAAGLIGGVAYVCERHFLENMHRMGAPVGFTHA